LTLRQPENRVEEMPRSERIVVILPRELVDALTRLADAKGLARTAYIRMVLTEHVKGQGRER
jgi:predicted DNA binding CopG/RHH family protein